MEKDLSPSFSVSGLIAVINQTLEFAYPSVEVEGEVASFKKNHDKFIFFDLKDKTGSLNCFMMAWQLRIPIEDGMRVKVVATPKVTTKGKFSLTIKSIKPIGEGSLKRSFELLRKKLDTEGLFDQNRKRSLPWLPQNVAVITSVQSAGYSDFIKILNERIGGINLRVASVKVQGEQAADEIIKALKYFNSLADLPDVIVIIRGGGSADDLAVFNEEPLVRAVSASRVPTLSGVGHEIDESLVDLAVDKRASTPSNAAQMLTPSKQEITARTRSALSRTLPIIEQAISNQLSGLSAKKELVVGIMQRTIETKLTNIQQQQKLIASYSPDAILKRGYSIVTGELRLGSRINIITQDAKIKAKVDDYEKR